MTRNKLLIPTLSALAVTPTIALFGCSKNNIEQNILDAIFKPMDLTEKVEISKFDDEYAKLSDSDKVLDLIYGTFGSLNQTIGYGLAHPINIRDLYKANEGGFKINIQKCQVKTENNQFYGTLLGYVTYVFEKEHVITIADNDLTFKTNDYIMLTIDIVNAELIADANFSITWKPQIGNCIGFYKCKYSGGAQEFLMPFMVWSTSTLDVKNSHNWVPKNK